MSLNQPKYQEVINWIKNKIQTKELKPGDRLNSENELCELLALSRQTVRRGIGILEEEGLVIRVRGNGAFISDKRNANNGKKTRIAVVTTYVDSYIFPKTIQGIERVLFEHGYTVQIAFTGNSVEKERTVLEDIISRDDVAGIIIEATKSGLPNPNISLYQKLSLNKIPVLFINSYYPQLKFPHVTINDKETAGKAVNYLINKGHSSIGAILKNDDGQGHLRYTGYQKAMDLAGLPIREQNIIWLDTFDVLHMSGCREYILRRLEGVSAVLCYNDEVAFHLIQILREQGIRVPQDISVIGIDNSDIASHSEIPITSIPHPSDQLGELAANNLLTYIGNPHLDVTQELLWEVVERESVCSKDCIPV